MLKLEIQRSWIIVLKRLLQLIFDSSIVFADKFTCGIQYNPIYPSKYAINWYYLLKITDSDKNSSCTVGGWMQVNCFLLQTIG